MSGTFKVVDWSSGKSKYTIKCSETWDSLQFCNKKGKVKKTIFLDNLRSITVGRRSGGHSSITGKAKADRAFYLEHTGNANKKKIGMGSYKYICGHVLKNGNRCNRPPNCRIHK